MPDAAQEQKACPGCGAEVPPPKRGGRTRKWCSRRCSQKAGKARYESRHPERARAADSAHQRRYYRANRDAILKRVKMRTFGLTEEEYDSLLARADGHCEVCGDPFGEERSRCAHIDHCHETGEVRGLVCAPCNFALGNARDDPERLRALIDYLESHRANSRRTI